LLGDRKSLKPKHIAAAPALSLALRRPISIPTFPIDFIFSNTGDFALNWVWKLAASLSLTI
jgi:hypothetical protein